MVLGAGKRRADGGRGEPSLAPPFHCILIHLYNQVFQ
jgi:hypothetical protein